MQVYMFAAADTCGPYPTWGYGSPGAIKLVLGFFCAFAAEQRGIVGELHIGQYNGIRTRSVRGDLLSRDGVCEEEVLDGVLDSLAGHLCALVLVNELDLAQAGH